MPEKPEKTAVVLFNLGGPSEEAAIEPFLFNFFMDRNIIGAPLPLRYLVAKAISLTRGRGAARKAYRRLGGKSPLLENTRAQARALEDALQKDLPGARVFVSMRYWHPLAKDVMKDVAAFRPDRAVLLPLYPQYSTTTAFSSLEDWRREAKKAGLACPAAEVCCYPENAGFVSASADLIREALKTAPEKTRVLFSAHGLPEKIILSGDPYQRQCEATAEAIVKELGAPGLDWQLCYQSRVGPLQWIGPSVEEALNRAAADKTGVVVYPLAFVSEHVETLVEIDEEYRRFAGNAGVPYFGRAQTVGTHPAFIRGLRDLVLSRVNGVDCERRCPAGFSKCFMR